MDRESPERTGEAWRLCLFLALLGVGLIVAGPFMLRWWTNQRYGRLIYPLEEVPERRVAIVFGAAVWPGGRLSHVLSDRVDTAVALYEAGKVEKLLMTGDNSTKYYDEPGHMRDYAIQRGVPAEDIVVDYAGRRTYDSCYRARHIFGVTDAILVTQAFHLDRALFLAHRFGIDAVGVAADQRDYRDIRRYWWRELLATSLAWWETTISRPTPILGEKLPIFPE